MEDLLLIESAIRKNVEMESEWIAHTDVCRELALSDNKTKLDTVCPKCKNTTLVCCFASIGGGLDYWDNFCHVCLNPQCDYGVHMENRVMQSQERPEDGLCFWCQRNVFKFDKKTAFLPDP